jgi:endoglycosylceramidase
MRDRLRARAAPFLIVALLALAAAPAALAAPAAPLGHAGRWITDAQGRVLIPHGLNMVSKVRPYSPAATGFGADDARLLARSGLNVVRLGVIYAAVEPQPGSYDDAYLAGIARTVATLGRQGVYSLLDFHQDQYNERFHGEGFPDWAVQDDGLPNAPDNGFPGNYVSMPALQHSFDHLWANSPGPGGVGLAQRYASAWQHVAGRFRDNPSVLGYDLLNEPWPGTDFAPCAGPGGCPAFDKTLAAFERRSIRAVRKADPRHLVWYEPNVLFDFGAPTELPDLGDARAGLSFHDYCSNESSPTCPGLERQGLANAVSHSRKTGDALLLSEFGSTDSLTTLTRVESAADAQLMPWTEWAYCGCQDPTGSIPPRTEGVVLDPSLALTGTNVKAAKLAVLARPHPAAVAGTPLRLRFDAASKKLTFSWSTARAAGHGRYAADSCTSLFLPPSVYPHGYRVVVRGARVRSAPSAGLLELDSLARVSRISVTVTATKHGHTNPPDSAGGCRAAA